MISATRAQKNRIAIIHGFLNAKHFMAMMRCNFAPQTSGWIEEYLKHASWWIVGVRLFRTEPCFVVVILRLRWISYLTMGIARLYTMHRAKALAPRCIAAGVKYVIR